MCFILFTKHFYLFYILLFIHDIFYFHSLFSFFTLLRISLQSVIFHDLFYFQNLFYWRYVVFHNRFSLFNFIIYFSLFSLFYFSYLGFDKQHALLDGARVHGRTGLYTGTVPSLRHLGAGPWLVKLPPVVGALQGATCRVHAALGQRHQPVGAGIAEHPPLPPRLLPHHSAHVLQMCHAGGVTGSGSVTNVSHGWCCWLWQCYKCVTRVLSLALAVLQMCHTGGVTGSGSVTNVSHGWCCWLW
jgi:hypothetical protein